MLLSVLFCRVRIVIMDDEFCISFRLLRRFLVVRLILVFFVRSGVKLMTNLVYLLLSLVLCVRLVWFIFIFVRVLMVRGILFVTLIMILGVNLLVYLPLGSLLLILSKFRLLI